MSRAEIPTMDSSLTEDDSMRITHLLPPFGFVPEDPENSSMGGVTTTAWELAVRQVYEHSTSIVGLSLSGEPFSSSVQNIQLYGLPTWQKFKTGKLDLAYLLPAFISVMRQRPKLLHCYSNPALLHIPSRYRVLHLQNTLPEGYHTSVAAAVDKADAVICCSNYVCESVLQTYPQFKHKTYVVHNGARSFTPIRHRLREELGISQGALVLFFAGAVNPVKGLNVLAEAFLTILEKVDDVHLIIAGSSHLWHDVTHSGAMSAYESEVRALLARKPAYFLGNVPRNRMGEVYGTADIFVCPSIWDEPFGIVNVEAMAAGLPVVASNVGGIPEVVNDEVGRLVPPNDVGVLAAALLDLLQDDELRSRLAANAYSRAKLFDWDIAADAVERIYDTMLHSSGSRGGE